MPGPRKPALADSFRLAVGDEQWFLRDLLVGAVAAVVWVAGTGALAVQVAAALDASVGLAPGETPAPVAVAALAVLWIAVPAVAVAVRIRQRTLNISDNVEQYYRFDRPAALLAPPALLVAVVAVAGIALGGFRWYFSLVLLPVGLFALVRTLAFSYRVYSFSHPLLVQFVALVSTAVALGSVLAAVGTATGRGTLVEQALRTAGLPAWVVGTVSVEGFVVSGVAVAAALPVALALAYVLVQTVVSLGVRVLEPDVDRSAMRTGQRYPPFLDSTTPVGNQAGTGDPSPGSAEPDDVGGESTTAAGGGSGPAGDGASADAAEADDEDLDDVSNTRVFTPPAEDDDGGLGAGSDADAGTESASTADATAGSGSAGETRAVQGSDADGPSSPDGRDRCAACGETFALDANVRFCPNCGTALGGE